MKVYLWNKIYFQYNFTKRQLPWTKFRTMKIALRRCVETKNFVNVTIKIRVIFSFINITHAFLPVSYYSNLFYYRSEFFHLFYVVKIHFSNTNYQSMLDYPLLRLSYCFYLTCIITSHRIRIKQMEIRPSDLLPTFPYLMRTL